MLVKHSRGFTLVETMVVMVICVGLVALMTGLYRSVGMSAIALRGGQQEWVVQRLLREQIASLFLLSKNQVPSLQGSESEIYFTSWQSKVGGVDGKPHLLHYQYKPDERAIFYREAPIPSWWRNRVNDLEINYLKTTSVFPEPQRILSGVEKFTLSYLSVKNKEPSPEMWVREWREKEPPKLIQIRFLKASKEYVLWIEVRPIEAN